jgi:hypothetical protein
VEVVNIPMQGALYPYLIDPPQAGNGELSGSDRSGAFAAGAAALGRIVRASMPAIGYFFGDIWP